MMQESQIYISWHKNLWNSQFPLFSINVSLMLKYQAVENSLEKSKNRFFHFLLLCCLHQHKTEMTLMTAARRCREKKKIFLMFTQANDKNCFYTGLQRMQVVHLRTFSSEKIIQFTPTYNLLMTWQVH